MSIFRYNALKHHLPAVREFVLQYRGKPAEIVSQALLPLGASQMDMYEGETGTDELFAEIQQQLEENGITDRGKFLAYLGDEGFRSLLIADGSEWILRAGDTTDLYVHLHPARYSKHSFRVKANSLKTVIACLCADVEVADVKQMNRLRAELGLSAVNPDGEFEQLKWLQEKIKVQQ